MLCSLPRSRRVPAISYGCIGRSCRHARTASASGLELDPLAGIACSSRPARSWVRHRISGYEYTVTCIRSQAFSGASWSSCERHRVGECLRPAVAAVGADAALITTLVNVRYLTGLASSNAALLLPVEGPALLATDSRYALAAERDCPDVQLLVTRPVETALAELAVSQGLVQLAFEAQEMTVERHTALAATDGLALLPPLGRRVEDLRVVKDAEELALLGRACSITGLDAE